MYYVYLHQASHHWFLLIFIYNYYPRFYNHANSITCLKIRGVVIVEQLEQIGLWRQTEPELRGISDLWSRNGERNVHTNSEICLNFIEIMNFNSNFESFPFLSIFINIHDKDLIFNLILLEANFFFFFIITAAPAPNVSVCPSR